MSKPIPKSIPAFCYIAPVEALDLTLASDRHLVLAHIILEAERNPQAQQYVDFYKNRSEEGDYIIVDNSAFELGESFDPNRLIEAAKLVNADALVLPDYPGQPASKTIEAAKKWIAPYKEAGLSTFFVPQSAVGDIDDWIKAYQWALDNEDIDMIGWSILGIPNALPHVPPAYARVVMAHILITRGVDVRRKYNHFLGLNSGPKLEIPALLRMEVLDSIDSSGPIWAGMNDVPYVDETDSFMWCNKAQLPAVDFFCERLAGSTEDGNPRVELVVRNVTLTALLFEQARREAEER